MMPEAASDAGVALGCAPDVCVGDVCVGDAHARGIHVDARWDRRTSAAIRIKGKKAGKRDQSGQYYDQGDQQFSCSVC